MDSLSDEIESILFIAREVMAPPRTTVSGYKAAEWNVESFVWKGRLRVDTTTGELFAQVTYAKPWTQVEPVLDSSRYFVLRVEGEGGKRVYVGMGFQERGEAFDFQVALQSVAKRSAAPAPGASSSSEPSKPAAPPKDYSLKEGQTFKINLPGREKKAGSASSASSGGSLLGAGGGGGGGAAGGLFSLPPPPPPGRKR
ncbi:hypothetical protein EHS25_005201 [Saitozyma podzolica]|uniref:NECAP PHear domain-containing protein n=1 Tax=Saitozyma podzolica TaxID=1890683 RepID=A0A427XYS8_9TREE|nr:hypothetical protein EHS25_005201 [Saitozyma podzolica]